MIEEIGRLTDQGRVARRSTSFVAGRSSASAWKAARQAASARPSGLPGAGSAVIWSGGRTSTTGASVGSASRRAASAVAAGKGSVSRYHHSYPGARATCVEARAFRHIPGRHSQPHSPSIHPGERVSVRCRSHIGDPAWQFLDDVVAHQSEEILREIAAEEPEREGFADGHGRVGVHQVWSTLMTRALAGSCLWRRYQSISTSVSLGPVAGAISETKGIPVQRFQQVGFDQLDMGIAEYRSRECRVAAAAGGGCARTLRANALLQ